MQQALALLFSLAKHLCTCPQPAGGDALRQDVLVTGQGMVPTSGTSAAEGPAMGNWAPWDDGNAEERGLPAPSDQPGWPGHPDRSWSSWAHPCQQWGCLHAVCSAGMPHLAGVCHCTEMSICVCVCGWCGVCVSGCTWVHLGCVCVRGCVSLVFTESLASAKEENVGIHQVLDQTLLELNNL